MSPITYSSEPFPEFISHFEDHMDLDLTKCPDETGMMMENYILWCGETDLDYAAFRGSWKKTRNRIRGLQENLDGGWSSPQPGLQRLSFWLFDTPGFVLFNEPDRLLVMGLDPGPASCDQAGYGDRTGAKDIHSDETPGITPPERTRHVFPDFPLSLRQERREAELQLSGIIALNGKLTDLCVLSVHPDRRDVKLAAIVAVRQWRYEPAMLDGQPVEMHLKIDITFTLH